jgi:hypothetical protein
MEKLSPTDALRALAKNSVNRSKIGRLRELILEIEAAQRAGVSITEILETLIAQGLDFKEKKSFESTLYRIRKEMGMTRNQRKTISVQERAVSIRVEREEKQEREPDASIEHAPHVSLGVQPKKALEKRANLYIKDPLGEESIENLLNLQRETKK